MIRLLALFSVLSAVAYGLKLPSAQSLDARIIGGIEASIAKFPYQVSVRAKTGVIYTHSCGGSIYNPRVIVTAAHCLYGHSPDELRVVAGVSYLNAIAALLEIEFLIVNSKYSSLTIDNDVGLIILANPLVYGSSVQPIRLAQENPTAGKDAVVTGWGTTVEIGSVSEYLQEVTVQIVDHSSCAKSYGPSSTITDNMICAGVVEGGKDVCRYDSGGPLVVDGELVGIVSWGRGCARAGYPGVYASVPELRTWIEEQSSYYS